MEGEWCASSIFKAMRKPIWRVTEGSTAPYRPAANDQVGADFDAPGHIDTALLEKKLSELQGEDPLILTLARGHYCPKEHQQHLELAAFYPKIAVAYTQIATIATDDHHTLQEFRASVGAQWTFLSDPDRTIQKDLDIQEFTDVSGQ